MKFETIISHAIDLANKSPMQHKHGAVIVSNGEIVGRGFNHMTSIMSHSWSCHAEVAALLSMGPLIKTIPSDDLCMIVVRVSKNDGLKLSTPCDKCKQQLKKFGIRKIFYST